MCFRYFSRIWSHIVAVLVAFSRTWKIFVIASEHSDIAGFSSTLKYPTYICLGGLGKTMISRALSVSLICNNWRLQFYWPELYPLLTGGDYSILDVVK